MHVRVHGDRGAEEVRHLFIVGFTAHDLWCHVEEGAGLAGHDVSLVLLLGRLPPNRHQLCTTTSDHHIVAYR